MPLTPKQRADRKLDSLIQKLSNTKAAVAEIQASAAQVLPQLTKESLSERKEPSGRTWRPNKRPANARPLDEVEASLRVEVQSRKLIVRSDHPGSGHLQQGNARQKPRRYLPIDKLTRPWRYILTEAGRKALAKYYELG